jgi:hypothetical protein
MKKTLGHETDFGVISLTSQELLALPKDERDFLIAASFIANDIRFHWSMMVRSPIDSPMNDLKAMQCVRWFWCSRKLSSVIVEATDTLDKFCGKLTLLKKIVREKSPIISSANRKSKFSNVAREFRNKSAYHYSHGDLATELEGFDRNAVHRIFAHTQSGNSISELAEQIFTLPTLKRIANVSDFEGFNSWCIQCSKSIMKFCEIATAELLLASNSKKGFDPVTLIVNQEAAPQNLRWPLFVVT